MCARALSFGHNGVGSTGRTAHAIDAVVLKGHYSEKLCVVQYKSYNLGTPVRVSLEDDVAPADDGSDLPITSDSLILDYSVNGMISGIDTNVVDEW